MSLRPVPGRRWFEAGIVAAALLALAWFATPARAQFSSVTPPFAKLTGGYLWGSLGYRDVRRPERFYVGDRHPFVRGGVAALLGPFGGQPDTIVTLDSVRTVVEWMQGKPSTPGAVRVDTLRTVHAVRSHHTLPGRDGWVSLAVGYQYAGAYRIDARGDRGTLAATFPVGGLYGSAWFGPFQVWHASRIMFWYATLGASVVQLSQANGTSDSTLVRFDTERALAPEFTLLLGWRAHRGVRLIGGIGAQHIRWSSVRYRSPSELPLADPVLRRLPPSLRLTSVHVNLGVSFDATDLFGR
ncbi:MAG TPA: hypothetical protein VFI79_04715 [Gemmatimonadales bacterium]|nr:hypothetical protein [Gemmatimonadales bacterium]